MFKLDTLLNFFREIAHLVNSSPIISGVISGLILGALGLLERIIKQRFNQKPPKGAGVKILSKALGVYGKNCRPLLRPVLPTEKEKIEMAFLDSSASVNRSIT